MILIHICLWQKQQFQAQQANAYSSNYSGQKTTVRMTPASNFNQQQIANSRAGATTLPQLNSNYNTQQEQSKKQVLRQQSVGKQLSQQKSQSISNNTNQLARQQQDDQFFMHHDLTQSLTGSPLLVDKNGMNQFSFKRALQQRGANQPQNQGSSNQGQSHNISSNSSFIMKLTTAISDNRVVHNLAEGISSFNHKSSVDTTSINGGRRMQPGGSNIVGIPSNNYSVDGGEMTPLSLNNSSFARQHSDQQQLMMQGQLSRVGQNNKQIKNEEFFKKTSGVVGIRQRKHSNDVQLRAMSQISNPNYQKALPSTQNSSIPNGLISASLPLGGTLVGSKVISSKPQKGSPMKPRIV